MNQIETSFSESAALKQYRGRIGVAFCLAALALTLSSCSSDKEDKAPTVSVQVAPVEKETIEHTVSAQAILFPLQQAAIVPKISAPVQKFLVKRGSPVKEGQLLAVLENKDLSAAAQDTEGAYKQAQAVYDTTTAASLPEHRYAPLHSGRACSRSPARSINAE